MAVMTLAAPARADDATDLFRNGHFFGELRYRYQSTRQDGFANEAQANTLRADLGFETGLYKDFTARLDFQTVQHIGAEDFNDLENHQAAYPIVADPVKGRFREAWVMWTGLPDTRLKAGRQEITLDNQRFVGNLDFRQNDQTFDAGTALWSPLDNFDLQYSDISNVNRPAGPGYSGHTHLLHAAYAPAEWLRVAGYGYFIDIRQAPALSSQTYGLQASGAKALTKDLEFDYLAEYARQSDYAGNPDNYLLHYWHLRPSLLWKNVTAQLGYESLGGNGTDAVQTPLGDLHEFNGWADMFQTTPPDGLHDRYVRFSYRLDGPVWLKDTSLDAIYHDYTADRTSARYGCEWDFQAQRHFTADSWLTKDWTLSAQFATYRADMLFRDADKLWLSVDTRF